MAFPKSALPSETPELKEAQELAITWKAWLQKHGKKISLLIALSLLVLASAVGGFSFWRYSQSASQEPLSLLPAESPAPSPSPTPDPLAPYNILLMGYGGGGHAGGRLTDTMMIASLHPREQEVFLISLPRDLWVPLPIEKDGQSSWWKINAAYQIGFDDKKYVNKPEKFRGESGGMNLAKETVSTVTGLPIHAGVTVNFASFVGMVDLLGGLDVQVQRAFTDPWYPIEGKENDPCGRSPEDIAAFVATVSATEAEKGFPCRYETLDFPAGKVTMDGVTALKYARSRHSATDGGDFNRALRQKQVLLAARQKVFSTQALPKLVPLATTAYKNVETDLSLTDALSLLQKYSDIREYEVVSLALTDKNVLVNGKSSDGQYVLQPKAGQGNWEEIHQWITDRFQKIPEATPSAGLKQ